MFLTVLLLIRLNSLYVLNNNLKSVCKYSKEKSSHKKCDEKPTTRIFIGIICLITTNKGTRFIFSFSKYYTTFYNYLCCLRANKSISCDWDKIKTILALKINFTTFVCDGNGGDHGGLIFISKNISKLTWACIKIRMKAN